MRILAIESSSLVASVAILEDDLIVAEYTLNHRITHSQTLLPMIDEIVTRSETPLESIDAIAVAAGPGSFTGLRIGTASAKGLGEALKCPLVPVPTIMAMAMNAYGFDGVICPIMDARREQTYTGIYRVNENGITTILDQSALDIHDLAERINAIGEKVIFIGDGIPVFSATLEEVLSVPHIYAPAGMNRQKASCVALIGAMYLAQGKVCAAKELLPDYLRVSQAERERMEREAHKE